LIVQASEALLDKPLAPQAYYLTPGGQPLRDLVIGQAFSSQQDHLCPNDLKIRQRIFRAAPTELFHFLVTQDDAVWALSWHPPPHHNPER
jgi:hypothetical protein